MEHTCWNALVTTLHAWTPSAGYLELADLLNNLPKLLWLLLLYHLWLCDLFLLKMNSFNNNLNEASWQKIGTFLIHQFPLVVTSNVHFIHATSSFKAFRDFQCPHCRMNSILLSTPLKVLQHQAALSLAHYLWNSFHSTRLTWRWKKRCHSLHPALFLGSVSRLPFPFPNTRLSNTVTWFCTVTVILCP